MADPEIITTKINEIEMAQIAEEIRNCLDAGVSSWDILRILRTLRKSKENGNETR